MCMAKYRSILNGDFPKLNNGERVSYVYSDELKEENGKEYLKVDGEWVEIDEYFVEYSLNIHDVNGVELMENDVVSFDRLGESYLGIITDIGGYAGVGIGDLGTFVVPEERVIDLFDGNTMILDENRDYASFPFDELITNIRREHSYLRDNGYFID